MKNSMKNNHRQWFDASPKIPTKRIANLNTNERTEEEEEGEKSRQRQLSFLVCRFLLFICFLSTLIICCWFQLTKSLNSYSDSLVNQFNFVLFFSGISDCAIKEKDNRRISNRIYFVCRIFFSFIPSNNEFDSHLLFSTCLMLLFNKRKYAKKKHEETERVKFCTRKRCAACNQTMTRRKIERNFNSTILAFTKNVRLENYMLPLFILSSRRKRKKRNVFVESNRTDKTTISTRPRKKRTGRRISFVMFVEFLRRRQEKNRKNDENRNSKLEL